MTLPRLLVTALVAGSVVTAAPAYADFDVTPSACDARVSPWDGRGVFSAENPNSSPTFIDYGNDNIILESPHFREGQPTEFAPGFHEGIFRAYFSGPQAPHVNWYLQGALARATSQGCDDAGAPVNTVAPRFTGDPVAGQQVEVDPGTWAGGGPGGVWRAAWLESCAPHGCQRLRLLDTHDPDVDPAATALSLTVPAERAGERLRVVVAAYSWRGVTLAASPLSAPVSGGTTPSAPVPTFVARGWRDVDLPHVVGGTLVAPPNRLDWVGFPQPDLTFAWERCSSASADDCAAIPGATGLTYRLGPDDGMKFLRVAVTGTNASGTFTSTTLAVGMDTSLVGEVSRAVAVDTPTLSGTPQVGEQLTTTAGSWIAIEPPRFQWQRCATTCADISGADGASYVPTAEDTGSRIRAVVLATGAAPVRPSVPVVTRFATAPTEPVAAAPTAPAPAPTTPTPTPTPPPAGTSPDVTAPRVTGVSVAPRRVRAATWLRLSLDEAATLRIDVRRPRASRPWATLQRTATPGAHRVRIPGQLGRRHLAPGRYLLTVVATDASGNRSAAVQRSFTVLR